MLLEHRYPDSAIHQQSEKKGQEEQQASHKNKYTCTAHAEVAEARSPCVFMQYLQEPDEMLKNEYNIKDTDTKGVLPPGTRFFSVVS